MQRSSGMLQDFPVELLTEICLCSALPTLANVRLVSKGESVDRNEVETPGAVKLTDIFSF